jgi:glyoxylase-like metal-dependent hydrolase (beta-lactamase superfamily II)
VIDDRMLIRIAILSLTLAAGVEAQEAARVVARDTGATMERLAEGVYAIVHEDAIRSFPDGATDWPHSNVGVIVGDDAVLVIDSDFYPSRAAADIALIRRVTSRPVRYLVNTHWHGDHTHGNAVYADSFPGLTIVGTRPNAQFIGINQARYPRSAIRPGSSTRALVELHEGMLARGADSSGRAYTAAERTLLGQVIAQRRLQLSEFAKVRVAPPTLLFDEAMALDLGGRRVELVDRGHANSPSDVTAWLPRERILFTGDILVWPVPYTFDAYPRPWLAVLRDLEALPTAAIVPGHGPVFRDRAYLSQVRTLLERAVTQADSLIRKGNLRPDIERLIDLRDLEAQFVKPGDATARAYWDAAVKSSLLERVYQCQVGSRC